MAPRLLERAHKLSARMQRSSALWIACASTCALAHPMHVMSHQASLFQQRYRMHTLSAPTACTLCMTRALIYTNAWRVIASPRTMRTMCKTFAAQRSTQVRKHACGNAREKLNACAQERERYSGPHFREDQNCMATHMSCVRTSHLSVRWITCASTCMLADPMRPSRASSASRRTTMHNLCMDARVNVGGTHIGYTSAQHVIAAARKSYYQASGMLNSRAKAGAHVRIKFADKARARTIV